MPWDLQMTRASVAPLGAWLVATAFRNLLVRESQKESQKGCFCNNGVHVTDGITLLCVLLQPSVWRLESPVVAIDVSVVFVLFLCCAMLHHDSVNKGFIIGNVLVVVA